MISATYNAGSRTSYIKSSELNHNFLITHTNRLQKFLELSFLRPTFLVSTNIQNIVINFYNFVMH